MIYLVTPWLGVACEYPLVNGWGSGWGWAQAQGLLLLFYLLHPGPRGQVTLQATLLHLMMIWPWLCSLHQGWGLFWLAWDWSHLMTLSGFPIALLPLDFALRIKIFSFQSQREMNREWILNRSCARCYYLDIKWFKTDLYTQVIESVMLE